MKKIYNLGAWSEALETGFLATGIIRNYKSQLSRLPIGSDSTKANTLESMIIVIWFLLCS